MQVILLTFLFGFAILGYLAIRVYEEHHSRTRESRDHDRRDSFHWRGHSRRSRTVV